MPIRKIILVLIHAFTLIIFMHEKSQLIAMTGTPLEGVNTINIESLKNRNFNAKDSHGMTILMTAAWNNNVPLFKYLLKKGAKADARDGLGNTALTYAIVSRSSDVAKLILDSNFFKDYYASKNHIELIFAIYFKNNIKIIQILATKSIFFRTNQADGTTAMMWAVLKENFDAVKILIKNKFDVRSKNKANFSAADYAKLYRQNETLALLKRAGSPKVNTSLIEKMSYQAVPRLQYASMNLETSDFFRHQEEGIRETVFRYAIHQSNHDASGTKVVYRLRVSHKDPTDKFMKRFSNSKYTIRKGSEAYSNSEDDDNEMYVLLEANDIQWYLPTKVEINFQSSSGPGAGSGGYYELTFFKGKWTVTNFTDQWVN